MNAMPGRFFPIISPADAKSSQANSLTCSKIARARSNVVLTPGSSSTNSTIPFLGRSLIRYFSNLSVIVTSPPYSRLAENFDNYELCSRHSFLSQGKAECRRWFSQRAGSPPYYWLKPPAYHAKTRKQAPLRRYRPPEPVKHCPE